MGSTAKSNCKAHRKCLHDRFAFWVCARKKFREFKPRPVYGVMVARERLAPRQEFILFSLGQIRHFPSFFVFDRSE